MLHRLALWARAGSDFVAASMLAAIFATFLVQVAARYVFNYPLGWTVEVCLTLWLWLVLFGSSACLSDRDHVKFDVLYLSVGTRTRRIMAGLSALAVMIGIASQLPAAWDYVDFYKIRRSATLRIPLNQIYSIYLLFCGILIVRYGWGLVQVLRNRHDDPAVDPFAVTPPTVAKPNISENRSED
ncbi:Tripartite ATP-independent transporter, DctQ component [Roseicitreum antarcticum]|uniref:TRAP transporter small permease protein n=2 Tax=Roseicitreum antarcticum TaxID=564137 RepID=A0A1H2UJW5_9RHOB|nr:Tripartite ATP-independent transporter, DctQ component [Roseicitreum antarcticum]